MGGVTVLTRADTMGHAVSEEEDDYEQEQEVVGGAIAECRKSTQELLWIMV